MKSINLAGIDLNLLVAFEAMFEERSVTAAAAKLHLGQPAMSAALGRLRALFEDDLFIRFGREMQPTTKALALAPGILSALQQIRQTMESNQTFNPANSDRNFAIGISDSLSYLLAPKLLAQIQNIAPNINLQFIGFDKDCVGELLELGKLDVALGVFQNLPRQTVEEFLFEEHFVGIARKKHPALVNGSMSLESFASLPHALFTLRRDTMGEIDQVLAKYNLKRRVALTTAHALVLPVIISNSDLIACIPSRLAKKYVCQDCVKLFELPVPMEPWNISILWSKLVEKDSAISWLRQTIKVICQDI